MIYGLIPVGGKGLRLGLPYSKEMLPQKNFDYFNPICNHLVEKMELAGATMICFVHGSEYKNDIREYFKGSKYVHILQQNLGFANVIYDFYKSVSFLTDTDKVLFGLPDSVFNENPFVEMLNKDGIVCGLFTTTKSSKVDRLAINNCGFQVKVSKTETNQDWFWGVLKFDGQNIRVMSEDNVFNEYSEIGDILNMYHLNMVKGDSYLDLGTWQNYNRYLTDSKNFTNVEIEKKYDADNIDLNTFLFLASIPGTMTTEITSTDHYYTIDNPNIEFVRYREDNDPNGLAIPDITVKNFNKSQLNRFELSLKLINTKPHNVMHFLGLVGCKFEFSVTKHCHIISHKDYTIVYYSFDIGDKKTGIVEIELNKIDFNIINQFEEKMSTVDGFDPNNIITKSKFQLIKDMINDSTH